MYIYIVYYRDSLDVLKVFLSEDDIVDYFTSFETSFCSNLDWKAINVDYFFKYVMNMFK